MNNNEDLLKYYAALFWLFCGQDSSRDAGYERFIFIEKKCREPPNRRDA